MISKKLSHNLIFRQFIDSHDRSTDCAAGTNIKQQMGNSLMRVSFGNDLDELFLKDITGAKKVIHIDIPGGTEGNASWFARLADGLSEAKERGVKVYIRVESRNIVPVQLQPYVIENKYIANPVALIDKDIVWYGEPHSSANFISEGKTIPTLYRPVIRYQGENFRRALYGFLEMNRTVDTVAPDQAQSEDGSYSSFAAYVGGEVKCSKCGCPMQLKKSKRGKFYMACSEYPKCEETQFVEPELVDCYFYHNNKKGKRCPKDNTSLEAGIGKYGIYVKCNGLTRHYYKLDEI